LPKLPRVSGRKLARALERAGFELLRVTGDHACYRHRVANRRAVVPLTPKTLQVGTLASVLRQAGLSADDLRSLLR